MWCTGYRVEIPFLDAALLGPDPKTLRLYKRILHLDHDDLFFIGLMQSTGSAFPILERQSQLLAEHLTGTLGAARRAAHARRCRAARPQGPRALGRPRAADDARRLRRLHARARSSEIERGGGRRSVSRRAIVTGAGGAIGSALVADAARAAAGRSSGLDLPPTVAT